jgi:hypothetical protein
MGADCVTTPIWLQPQFVGPPAALIGGALTFAIQRYSDLVKSPDRLREDLKKATLGPRGQNRLRPIALIDQKRFTGTFERPDATYLAAWDQENHAIFVTPAEGTLRAGGVVGGDAPQRQSVLVRISVCAEAGSLAESAVRDELNAILRGRAEAAATFPQMLLLAEPEDPVLVIVECLGITIRRPHFMDRLLDVVKDQIQSFFSSAVIGLTIHAPEDAIQERRSNGVLPALIILPRRENTPVSVEGAAQEYTLLRNAFSAQLGKGIVLQRRSDQTNMSAPAREKMAELARARLTDKDLKNLGRSNGKDTFGTVCIWGPPGSGKTALANIFCAALQNQKAIVLDVYGLDFAPLFVSGSQLNIGAIDDLLKPCAYSRMEMSDDEFGQSRQAFEDAWSYALQQRKQVVWLLIEDLYNQKAMRQNIDRLRELSDRFNVRVLVVDRKRLRSLRRLDERFAEFECQLWEREEAEALLRALVQDEAKELLEGEMRSAWWTSQDTFSSYTLEIIAHNLGNVEFADSADLLRDTISLQTGKIITVMGGVPQIDSLLSRMRTLLQARAPYESILQVLEAPAPEDPVLVLGQIAWFSQFKDEHATFGPDDLTRWFKGTTKRAAESLLAEGVTAGIFSQSSAEAYEWAHMLVRDGCAALYLREQFGALERQTAAEMVRRLHEAGSVAILALAFDSAMLQKTISDLLLIPQLLGDILDHLLTGQMLMRLAQSPDTVDIVAGSIFAVAETLTAERTQDPLKTIAALSRAIARLRPLSKTLNAYVSGPLDLEGAMGPIMIGAETIGQERNGRVFWELRQRFADMDTALDMAARLWRPEGLETLMNEFVSNKESLDPVRIASLLQVFVERNEESFLFEKIQNIVQSDFLDRYGSNEEVACIASRAILRRAFVLIPKADRTLMGTLRRASARQIDLGHLHLAGELARWASCVINRDVGFFDVKWTGYKITSDLRSKEGRLLARAGSYAVPMKPFPADILLNILKITYGMDEDLEVKSVLTLPAKADLERVQAECGAVELVRDNLPEGYVYDPQQLPPGAQLATWDGERLGHIDTRSFNRAVDRLAWRPKMCL